MIHHKSIICEILKQNIYNLRVKLIRRKISHVNEKESSLSKKYSKKIVQMFSLNFYRFYMFRIFFVYFAYSKVLSFHYKIFAYVFVKECKKIKPDDRRVLLLFSVPIHVPYNPDLSRRSHPRNPRASFLKENCGFSIREICDRTLGITAARCAVVGKVQKRKCRTMETSWCVIALPNLATMF